MIRNIRINYKTGIKHYDNEVSEEKINEKKKVKFKISKNFSN